MARTFTRQSAIRAQVRERAAGRCELCGAHVDPTAEVTASTRPSMHHRYPRRMGGLDAVSNLLYLCRDCHTFVVHADEENAILHGWLCDNRNTARTALLTMQGWVLHSENGSVDPLEWWQGEGHASCCEEHEQRSSA